MGSSGHFLQGLPIERKLVGIILLTCVAVLGVTCGVLLTFEILTSRATTARSLSTIANVVAENSSAALIFDDQAVAREIITGVRVEPEITHAALYNEAGKIVATYPKEFAPTGVIPPGGDTVFLRLHNLTVYKPVLQDGRRVGTVLLEGTFQGTYHRLGIYGLVLLAVLGCSIILAYSLSTFFQRLITGPLLNLARTARAVSAEQDYSVRATKISDDEFGVLTDAFNAMLDQIDTAHSALREGEERFRTLADNMAQLAWTADELGYANWYNKRWYDYTGTTAEEMTGRGWEQIHHPDHLERVKRHLQECFQAGQIWEDTFPLRGREGEYRWFLSRAVPIKSADGRVVRWFGTNTDVTDQRAVAEQLARARDEALSAARAKDNFLAALSHELRTPLSPVLLLASEAAQNSEFSAEAREHFETIRKNVELEARLIDDLLDLTSVTRGKLVLKRQPVSLHAILADAVTTVRADITAKNIEVTMDLAAPHPVVVGDAIRLQQVFWNVLKNAVKFTPRDGRIGIVTGNSEDAREARIEISDTGIGMSAEEIGRVFEAFSQGDHASPTSSHRFGGLGLGLAISRSVVELHSGQIAAESAGRNLGSRFLISLPVASAVDGAALPSLPRAAGNGRALARSGANRRVLLVEDHAPTRNAITFLLQRRQFEVVAAESLAEARTLAAREKFQILISDIGLPDGNGYQLMKELAANGSVMGIALTGYGMEEDVRQALSAGFLVHLIKPVQVAALEDAMRQVLAALDGPVDRPLI